MSVHAWKKGSIPGCIYVYMEEHYRVCGMCMCTEEVNAMGYTRKETGYNAVCVCTCVKGECMYLHLWGWEWMQLKTPGRK